MNQETPCPECAGEGTITETTSKDETCGTCHGLGRLPASWPETADVVCYTCSGTGSVTTHQSDTKVCRSCNGVGHIRHEIPESSS